VKEIQTRKGSRHAYAHVEQNGGWRTEIDDNLAAFLADTTACILPPPAPTASPISSIAAGPKGFVKILDKNTAGVRRLQRQPASTSPQGNLSEIRRPISSDGLCHRRRVKIWGEARVVDDDPALLQSLMPQGYKARPEQVILFKISAWDTTARSISRKSSMPPMWRAALASRDARIAELEAELAALKGPARRAHQSVIERKPAPD